MVKNDGEAIASSAIATSPDVRPPKVCQYPGTCGQDSFANGSAALPAHSNEGVARDVSVGGELTPSASSRCDEAKDASKEDRSSLAHDSGSSCRDSFDSYDPWSSGYGSMSFSESDDSWDDDHRSVGPRVLLASASLELDEEQLSRVPLDDMGRRTSIGSVGHREGHCAPCVFVFTAVGCSNGVACHCCHMPHPEQRQKERRPCRGGAAMQTEAGQTALREDGESPDPSFDYVPREFEGCANAFNADGIDRPTSIRTSETITLVARANSRARGPEDGSPVFRRQPATSAGDLHGMRKASTRISL